MGDMVKFRPNKKVMLSVASVLGVLIVAGAAGFGFRSMQNNNTDVSDSGGIKGQPLPEKVDNVQNLRLDGDDDGALKKIDETLASGDVSSSEKYQLYIQQGNAYSDKNDIQSAITSYLAAEQVKSTYEVTTLLAEKYEKIGNTEQAIVYWKKSIPLIEKSPMSNNYKQDAENSIKRLGGQI